MSPMQAETGFASINGAQIYYETAGRGSPLVMIHAGVADSRQWESEFTRFATENRVVRFDLRNFGRSLPAAGKFRHLDDLTALLDLLVPDEPVILMGCSIGGGLAMDYALAHPDRARGLIMVASSPSGLELDVPEPENELEQEAIDAFNAGDLERAAEAEARIWIDGMGRTPQEVDPVMRARAIEMNRLALAHEAGNPGMRLSGPSDAAGRLSELTLPVLVIVGEHDIPYMHAAAEYMQERLPDARLERMAGVAHLLNMEKPAEFQQIVAQFLEEIA
ncbi:MAG: alpha/beta hydrolase [Caldilineaceae bacterium]|nr:alpha/beta hydrolase [Caldilineaceae bacterium]